jgi:hypothetical protein
VAKVNSVIDTILGEAVSGTKAQRYQDMLGIASVISNRATVTAKTPHSIVSAPNQFNAYGKGLPPGAAAYRSMAQKAWDTVQKLGPVHNATFYATPSATKNLPSGLSPVTSTKGHQYFFDPQNRAIATAAGYVTPKASIAGPLAPQSAAQAMLSPEAYGMASAPAPSPPKGMEALAPNGLKGTGPLASYSRVGLDPGVGKVMDALSKTAAGQAIGGVNSGYRSASTNAAAKGASKSQHMIGKAVDLDVRGLTNAQKQSIIDTAIEAGAKGIGIYSSGNSLHVDTRANPAAWGPQGYSGINNFDGVPGDVSEADIGSLPGWAQASIRDMYGAGTFAVTPRTTAPTPTARPETPATFAAAPVGKVERMALAPAAPRAPDPARFAYDVTPPSQPSGFGIVSAAQAASMPPDPMTTAKVGRLAPAVSMPARPTTPTPATALQAMNKPAFAPSMAVPTSAIAGLVSKAPTAPTQTFTPQPTTLMPPSVVAPPAPPAPVARVSAPVSRPSMPAAPRATAMDVYSGAAMQAMDNTGKNMVSRDALGNMSVTNQYGVTTTTSPSGFSSVSFGPKAPSAPSAPSAISGPLSQPGISTPSKGFLGIEPAKTETGNIARGVVGSAVGSAIGSTLGPIGSLIGAALGNSIAKGKNPFDALTGRQGLVSFNTPALGVINAFAPQTGGAFGTFPGKPTGTPGALGGKQSNNSMGGMRGISPGAAAAIGKGVGGLY